MDVPARPVGLWGVTALAALAALATLQCSSDVSPFADAAADKGGATDRGGADAVQCGDGICSKEEGEDCQQCPADCGACPLCGDGTCDPALESCDSCAADCGACGSCGDGECRAPEGEACDTCPSDCGTCLGCGDGTCDAAAGETCASCPQDCSACDPCGDGTCDAAAGETCASCPDDCDCPSCGDGECTPSAGETCATCSADCAVCPPMSGCVQGSFNPYFGMFHSHTSYSDGVQTPAKAFAHARNIAKLDFLAVTDHRKSLTSSEWSACWSQADAAYVNGTFVTLCGYEFNVGVGHLNVLFSRTLLANPTSLTSLYSSLAGCSKCIGQWNHPRPSPEDFSGYKYFSSGKDAMRLMELSGGSTWDFKFSAYFQALGKGWLISPSMNEDNHQATWGDSDKATGVWMTKRSRSALRLAMQSRRTFSTSDDTAWIKMTADSVCWMGSVLVGKGPSAVTVVAQDKEAADGFSKIDLYGPNKTLLASYACAGANPCTAKHALNIVGKTFVVALARQQDGGRLVSAPLWYQP